jgi:hypothetical protein
LTATATHTVAGEPHTLHVNTNDTMSKTSSEPEQQCFITTCGEPAHRTVEHPERGKVDACWRHGRNVAQLNHSRPDWGEAA